MQEITSCLYKEKICENLLNMNKEQKKDFYKIKSLFDKSYIMGGVVRDSILQVEHKYGFPIHDLDILIDDRNFDEKLRNNFSMKNLSRFGGLKLKYPEYNSETDVFAMENIFYLKNLPKEKINIENVLKGVDLTTSAFAYDLEKDKIYQEHGALEDIFNKEINVSHDNSITPATISRLILHADKTDFNIGKKGKEYLKQKYSESLDSKIKDYLKYKEPEKYEFLFSIVKERLNSML